MNEAQIQADCQKIFDACKKLGTNEKAIIEVLGNRNLQERHAIRLQYMKMFHKDLLDVFESELSGDFRTLVHYLFLGAIQVLAAELYKTIKKIGSAGAHLNDILCACNNKELFALKMAYTEVLEDLKPKDFKNRSLEKDVEKESKGNHQQFLLGLLRTQRPEFSEEELKYASENNDWDTLVDMAQIRSFSQTIHAAGDTKAGKANESVIMEILLKCSVVHIRCLHDTFLAKYQVTLADYLSKCLKEPLKSAINTFIMSAVNIRMLLASQLYNSMHGLGTDERTLTRIIVIRSEMDIDMLKKIFQQKYSRSLVDSVKGDTSGYYRDLLIALINK